ncbi:MAG TPA: hypothetical protein VLT33_10185, partial [Labilithrix sp.]|nr:hypothetical protein [Labilithrix sp.]
LHRGLVDLRLLAQGGKTQQAFDLADTLECLPGLLVSWKEEHLIELRAQLEAYAEKYPDGFRYSDFIEKYDPPAF